MNQNLKKQLKDIFPEVKVNASIVNPFETSMDLIKQGGFPYNMENANPGKQASNTGDAVEALFVFRVLAYGYNVSKSESRVTDYDLIVEFKKTMSRVQVKALDGVPSSIPLKDRARGGQGIDQNHESNQGRPFTSERADVIAFVEKRTGVVFLLPLSWVEENNKEAITREELVFFKEKWDLFK